MQGEGRPGETQRVCDAGRREVLVVELDAGEDDTGLLDVAAQSVRLPGKVIGGAEEQADRLAAPLRGISGVLQGVVHLLVQRAHLRVENRRVRRGVAEERGVEVLDAGEDPFGADVAGIAQQLLRDARGQEFVIVEVRDALHPGHQVVPEVVHRLGRGEPTSHADDGDLEP